MAVLQHVKGLVRAEVEPRALRVGKRGRDALGAHARANVQVAPDGADGDGQSRSKPVRQVRVRVRVRLRLRVRGWVRVRAKKCRRVRVLGQKPYLDPFLHQ